MNQSKYKQQTIIELGGKVSLIENNISKKNIRTSQPHNLVHSTTNILMRCGVRP